MNISQMLNRLCPVNAQLVENDIFGRVEIHKVVTTIGNIWVVINDSFGHVIWSEGHEDLVSHWSEWAYSRDSTRTRAEGWAPDDRQQFAKTNLRGMLKALVEDMP